jgi:hypothetical protein
LLHRARRALRREFLHVAGDTPKWAALPFAGLIARRLTTMRSRLAHLGGEMTAFAGPLTSAVASVAVAVGAVTALGHDPSGPTRVNQRRVEVAAAPATAMPGLLPAIGETATTPVSLASPILDPIVAEIEPVYSLAGVAFGKQHSREKSEDSEIYKNIGLRQLDVVWVGANPSSILDDVEQLVDAVTETLTRPLDKGRR